MHVLNIYIIIIAVLFSANLLYKLAILLGLCDMTLLFSQQETKLLSFSKRVGIDRKTSRGLDQPHKFGTDQTALISSRLNEADNIS